MHVIIDAGHGGRDVGTDHDGVWEATYVYDVACRVKKTIESKTEAKVSMLTSSKSNGCKVPDRNVLEKVRDHEVLTTPRYNLSDPIVGVNLRWYLANSLYRRAIASATPKERVVFLSIHADSLHPSLRGAMAYIPGEQYVRGSYTKDGKIYLARAEVRESPTVTQSEEEALMAEGLSTQLAASIIDAFREEDLKVHPVRSGARQRRAERAGVGAGGDPLQQGPDAPAPRGLQPRQPGRPEADPDEEVPPGRGGGDP